MIKRFCNRCGDECGPDVTGAKVRRGLGNLSGKEIDCCGSCSVLLEAWLTGRPDASQPPVKLAPRPRSPRPRPSATTRPTA